MAALIGKRFGQHPYQIWGELKSWEGSLAMLCVSYIVCAAVLVAVQGSVFTTWAIAGISATVATVLESASKYGIDNISVPLGSAAVCYWLAQIL